MDGTRVPSRLRDCRRNFGRKSKTKIGRWFRMFNLRAAGRCGCGRLINIINLLEGPAEQVGATLPRLPPEPRGRQKTRTAFCQYQWRWRHDVFAGNFVDHGSSPHSTSEGDAK